MLKGIIIYFFQIKKIKYYFANNTPFCEPRKIACVWCILGFLDLSPMQGN